MFFSSNDVLRAVKISANAKRATNSTRKYCQRLTDVAREINFRSYHELQGVLNRKSRDENLDDIVREVCMRRLPHPSVNYFSFRISTEGGKELVSYFSVSDGVDPSTGRDVRVPDLIDPGQVLLGRQFLPTPIFVVGTGLELLAWQMLWHGRAFIPAELARSNLPRFFRRQ